MKKIDLHLHSTWSDGSMSIAEIIKFSKYQKIDVISITDHDSMENLPEVISESSKHNVKVIIGVEISAYNPDTGRRVHILGYNISDPQLITSECYPYLSERHETNLKALEIVRSAGYHVDVEDAMQHVGSSGILYRQHVMHALADRGYTVSIFGELYDKLYGKDGVAYLNTRYIKATEAIDLVKSAGGLAVLAHPFQYDSMGVLPSLIDCGLDGIELVHPSATQERLEIISQAAEQYKIFTTGGSDSHGFYSKHAVPLGSLEFIIADEHPLLQTN